MPLTSLAIPDQSGEIKVDAAHHVDPPSLKNNTTNELRISFTATGTWCLYDDSIKDPDLAVFNDQTDWKGYQLPKNIYDKHEWRQAGAPAGALLVELFDVQGAKKAVLTAPDNVDVQPGGSLSFVVNDAAWYAYNSGQITIKYKSLAKDIPATLTGKLLVLHDEWTLSDTGFQQAPDTVTFVKNIAKYFNNNKGGRFLDASPVYSMTHLVRGSALENTFTSSQYTFTKGYSSPLDLKTLCSYDGVFVGGESTDNQLLIDYIKQGGSVCVIAGGGIRGAQSHSALWSQLLETFGLRLEPSTNNIVGVLPITNSDHPLFTGVKALYQNNGNTVHLLPDSKASLIMKYGSQGLIAYAEFPVPKDPAPALPAALSHGAVIKLQSSKGDCINHGLGWEVLMHPMKSSGRDYTGNEWTVEVITDNKIRLRTQKGNYLHRPDNREVVITRGTGDGNEWVVEIVAENKIRLRSWKDDYLYRPSPNPAPNIISAGVTKSNTHIDSEWIVIVVPPATTPASAP